MVISFLLLVLSDFAENYATSETKTYARNKLAKCIANCFAVRKKILAQWLNYKIYSPETVRKIFGTSANNDGIPWSHAPTANQPTWDVCCFCRWRHFGSRFTLSYRHNQIHKRTFLLFTMIMLKTSATVYIHIQEWAIHSKTLKSQINLR